MLRFLPSVHFSGPEGVVIAIISGWIVGFGAQEQIGPATRKSEIEVLRHEGYCHLTTRDGKTTIW